MKSQETEAVAVLFVNTPDIVKLRSQTIEYRVSCSFLVFLVV